MAPNPVGRFMISTIEQLMYRISDLLLAPVLLAILFVFFFGFYALGGFAIQAMQRKKNRALFSRGTAFAPGYDVHNYLVKNPTSDLDTLEVYAFEKLEFLKLITKVAPMLGLIATMIPMGPALKSLADGNIQGISESLSVAFAGVIFALAAASLTFIVVSGKKRWLAQELLAAKLKIEEQQKMPLRPLQAVKEA
jgi:hypothetical protein